MVSKDIGHISSAVQRDEDGEDSSIAPLKQEDNPTIRKKEREVSK